MQGYPKNNVTLNHGSCACGDNCSCGDSCTCGTSEFQAEQWTWEAPRRNEALDKSEEKERQERSTRGVDPIVMAKLFKVQTEMMHKRFPVALMNDATSSVSKGLSALTDAVKEKSTGWSETFHQLGDKLNSIAHNSLDFTKEKLHMNQDLSTMAAEEKERTRRMSLKTDPAVDGRRHRVETELLHSVKMVN